ncbi:MAG: hypothetical protein KDA32_03770 [Phycisphaerales bacterium]|nr:hypothetical protein [Phycisphaerales bacterium]
MSNAIRVAGLAGLVVAASSGLAQSRLPGDGRLFDANPGLIGGRYNVGTYRPASPLLIGNSIASGNIGRGFAFQGVSPISDPTAFRAGVGSGLLSNFRRDSTSVLDAYRPGQGLTPELFYDPSRTAPSANALTYNYGRPQSLGTTSFGTVAPSPRRDLPGLLDAARPIDFRLRGEPQTPEDVFRGSINKPTIQPDERYSAIFGVDRANLPGPARVFDVDLTGLSDSASFAERVTNRIRSQRGSPAPPTPYAPLSFREEGLNITSPQASPLDFVLQNNVDALINPDRVRVYSETTEPTETDVDPLKTHTVDPSLLPGYDLFTDMRLATELDASPDAQWFQDFRGYASGAENLTPEQMEVATADSQQFLDRVLSAPLRSFVAPAQTPLNDELAKAESLMELGRYYDAAGRYERAAQIDPLNPLPIIGKAHALLAAGEYLSAATFLARGYERFPALTKFQSDLAALLGGGEIVDMRRADIMRRLANEEDYRLRFLLGYIEMNYGMRDRGVDNLRKASVEAPPTSMIRKLPALIDELAGGRKGASATEQGGSRE